MYPKALREKLAQKDKPPKVTIPVHLRDHPADMKEIHRVASEYGIRIIEDASHSIRVNLHYMPVHLQPFYQRKGLAPGQFPNAAAYAKEDISISLYFGLHNENQKFVVKSLKTVLS